MIKSDAFCAEKTLRFPRVVKIRYDKDWNEALKFEDLQVMMSEVYTKGIKKKAVQEGDDSEGEECSQQPEKSQKLNDKAVGSKRGGRKATKDILAWYKGVEIEESEIISQIFSGQ